VTLGKLNSVQGIKERPVTLQVSSIPESLYNFPDFLLAD
jgi:hypothetical protein